MRFCTSGSFSAFMISSCSLATTSLGVPEGAKTPYQVVMSSPGKPASAKVGTSASSSERRGDVTASARSLPPLIWPIADDVVSNMSCAWPDSISACAWLLPLYGMCVIDTPATFLNASPARCWVLPAPEDAKLKLSGLVFICATSSRTSRAVTEGPTISTLGTTMTSATGVRSLSASKLSLSKCGAIACPVVVATRSVCPSGGDLAVTSAAIVFDAPGRLSTTKGCLSASFSVSPSMRATMSVPPPAGAPTINRTGLEGNVCAAASCETVKIANCAAATDATAIQDDLTMVFIRALAAIAVFALASFPECDDLLLLLAQTLDAKRDDVAGLEILRRRLHAHAHTGRRARGDHVAGQQGHVLGNVGDHLGNAEDHRSRITGLSA